MSIDNELLTFANGCEPWTRDCLRRICTQSDLTAGDLQEILANLKSSAKLATAGLMQPLDGSHLANRTMTTRVPTILTSISDVKNANRLAPNQTLLFAEQGITLIYGYNGSGKTGYGRILKQVCRSRHEKPDQVLGDVFSANAAVPASAQIDYKSGGSSQTFQWTDGAKSPDELSLISVFDATTAPLYADKQNKIEFLPMGLDVLPRLGKAFEHLADAIDVEIASLDAKIAGPLPKVESATFIQFVGRLSSSSPSAQLPSESDIKTLFTWSKADDAALQTTVEEIRRLSEPAAQSGQLARLIGTLEGVKPKLESAIGSLGVDRVKDAQQKYENAIAAREAATIAASGRFAADPLGEAPTTAAWRKLYHSAEAFSAEVYPGEQFPATGTERVCLLCQQSVGQDAEERFLRFREFLKDTTQTGAVEAEQQLSTITRIIAAIIIPAPSDVDSLFKELTDTKPTQVALRDAVKQQCVALTGLKAEISQCLKGEGDFALLSPASNSVVTDLDVAIASLKAEKQTFDDQTKDTVALAKLRGQLTELIDRKNCAGNIAIFLARRIDLCERAGLKKCRSQCETSAISRKNSQLRDSYLTQSFQQSVMREVRNLGLAYLPLKVEGKTERGVGYIGIALSKTGREPTSRILSEGEFRGLALACFFAEIGSIAGHDGIIVDDPVSSLDHLHVEQVARRLVAEAKVRPQVVVFTHDLSFYYDLWMAAAEAGVQVHRNWIRQDGPQVFGHVDSNDGPWQVKNTKERLSVLEKMLKSAPDQSTTPPDEYLGYSESFYAKLRETWERLVEERLLNNVVGRFQPGVATQSLKGVSVTDDDYKKVFFAMKNASEFSGHDRSANRAPIARTLDEMKNDRGELWSYERELQKRSDALSSQRRALEVPPLATVTLPPKVP